MNNVDVLSQDVEVEDQISYSIVNHKTAAPTVLVRNWSGGGGTRIQVLYTWVTRTAQKSVVFLD